MPDCPFHLAHHILDDTSHGDLFLDTGDATLPTYEVSQEDLQAIRDALTRIPDPIYSLHRDAIESPDQVWPLKRKSDHRKKYLSYEGPVSNNRGQLYSVLKGRLKFTFPLKPLPEKLWFGVHAASNGQ